MTHNEFLSQIERLENGCWILLCKDGREPVNPHTYRQIVVDGRQVMAHRYAVESARGPVPEGMLVCHRCDNPPCINPDHLFVGTHSDNMQDMAEKRRTGRQRAARPTADVFLRDVPDDLWRRLKVRAAMDGVSLKAALIQAVTLWLHKRSES